MIEDKFQRIHVTFKDKELDSIEQYANSRGIKKATAVKELAIRGLELTTKVKLNTETNLLNKVISLLNNLGINRRVFTVTLLIEEHKYSEAITELKDIRATNPGTTVTTAINKAIEEVSKYESIANMNNYLNNR